MVAILFHSSKTMQSIPRHAVYQVPLFLDEATRISKYLQTLSRAELMSSMKLSLSLAEKTHDLLAEWSSDPQDQTPAIDIFRGDMYSGLRAVTFTKSDRAYANQHLYILSGLYGLLRACDSIAPYRLEMGYTLPGGPFKNLYTFWGDHLAVQIPTDSPIINLSAVEYTKALLPQLKGSLIITPQFMTRDPKSGDIKFVAIHAKIARGALAHWLIKNHATSGDRLPEFHELGYNFDTALSTREQPVFICNEFNGIGLSIRKQ